MPFPRLLLVTLLGVTSAALAEDAASQNIAPKAKNRAPNSALTIPMTTSEMAPD